MYIYNICVPYKNVWKTKSEHVIVVYLRLNVFITIRGVEEGNNLGVSLRVSRCIIVTFHSYSKPRMPKRISFSLLSTPSLTLSCFSIIFPLKKIALNYPEPPISPIPRIHCKISSQLRSVLSSHQCNDKARGGVGDEGEITPNHSDTSISSFYNQSN